MKLLLLYYYSKIGITIILSTIIIPPKKMKP